MIEIMNNRSILTKSAAILALSVCSILPAFAQSVVVGYAHPTGPMNGNSVNNFPSDAQLSKLTHVIVTSIGVYLNGTLNIKSNNMPNTWNGNKNTWLQGLVSRANSKGVKVKYQY